MKPWVPLLGISLLAMLLSGCIGGGDGDDVEPEESIAPVAGAGVVRGKVVEEGLDPIEGAKVNLLRSDAAGTSPAEVPTKADGSYEVRNVEPGRYTVIVFAIGFNQGVKAVDVRADTIHDVSFQMARLPSDDPSVSYNNYEGLIDYGYTHWVEPPGVGCITQDIPVRDLKTCGGSRGGDSVNGEIAINVTNDTKTVVVEMVWDPAGPLGEYLSLDLLCPDVPRGNGGAVLDIEHACYWDVDNTESPIVFRIDEADWLEKGYNFTGDWAARVFSSYGMLGTYETTGVDAGVAYQQSFTIYVSVFHKEPAPDGYTGIPDL